MSSNPRIHNFLRVSIFETWASLLVAPLQRNSQLSAGSGKTDRIPIDFDHVDRSPISGLLKRGFPSTISGFIAFVIFNSPDRVVECWGITHVPEKALEVSNPLWTNGYSTPSVIIPLSVGRASASGLHLSPRCVGLTAEFSEMFRVSTNRAEAHGGFKAPTASCVSSFQVIYPKSPNSSAFTSGPNFSGSPITRWSMNSSHSQLSKSFSNMTHIDPCLTQVTKGGQV